MNLKQVQVFLSRLKKIGGVKVAILLLISIRFSPAILSGVSIMIALAPTKEYIH